MTTNYIEVFNCKENSLIPVLFKGQVKWQKGQHLPTTANISETPVVWPRICIFNRSPRWFLLALNFKNHSSFLVFALWEALWILRLAFEMVNWVKQISLPSVDGHHPIHWKLNWKKKVKEGLIRCPFLSWDFSSFSCPRTSELLVLRPLDSRTYTSDSGILSPSDLGWWHHWPLWFSTLQMADCGTSQPP